MSAGDHEAYCYADEGDPPGENVDRQSENDNASNDGTSKVSEVEGEKSYDISPDEELLENEKQLLDQERNDALAMVEETGSWREKLNNETEVFISKE